MKYKQSGFRVYGRLLGVAKSYWPIFVIGLIATMMTSGIDAGFTWFIKPIINKGFIHRDLVFIRWLPIIMGAAFIFRSLSNMGSQYCVSRVARSVVMILRQRLFALFLRLPASYFDQSTSGQLLATIIYNVDQVAEASSRSVVVFLRETALLIGMLVVMFSLSWQLSVIILVVSPLMMWLVRLCSRRMRRLSHDVQDTIGEVTQVAEEGIELYRMIRLSGTQAAEAHKFNDATKRNRWQELKIVITNQINSSIVQLLIGVPAIGFLCLATNSFFHVTAGGFAAILTAMFGILRPARQLSNLNSTFQKGIAGAESIFALLDKPKEVDEGEYQPNTPVAGQISFDQVCFQHEGATEETLSVLDFDIAPGNMVAFVGPSGAGKTTLVNLLPRFYRVNSGSIAIDGTPINEYTLASLRQQIAFVTQDPKLFNATVADNIAYGQSVTEGDLIEAAKAAHAYDFIQALPQQFGTIVGENGVMLSGGQRQRIAIARAVIKKAPILILDEATSALDTASERHIQAALEELMAKCTTLVIAHRLSTVEAADSIIVLEAGRIVEQGTHTELLAKNNAYRELYDLQFSR